jgi:hypothetical protein
MPLVNARRVEVSARTPLTLPEVLSMLNRRAMIQHFDFVG